MLQYECVWEAEHREAEGAKHGIPDCIFGHHLGRFMNLSVEFDVDPVFRTEEIGDVVIKLMFTPEFQVFETPIS